MSITPPEQPPDGESGQSELFAGLDEDIFTGTEDPVMNGFMSMYKMLPEYRMANTIGSNVIVDTGEESDNLRFEPLAVVGHNGGIIGRDKTAPRAAQDLPGFLYLRGSVYASEEQVYELGKSVFKEAALTVVATHATGARQLESGLRLVYTPEAFCKDAHLVYSRAYPLEGLRRADSRATTLRVPLQGSVITIPLRSGQSQVLFIEAKTTLTRPVRNVYRAMGSESVPVLSYIND